MTRLMTRSIPADSDETTAALVATIAAQNASWRADLDARHAQSAAERLAAYTAATTAHGAAIAASWADPGDPSLAAAVRTTAEAARLAFAGWTSAPDDGTVPSEAIRNARAAGAAKFSRDLREAGRR